MALLDFKEVSPEEMAKATKAKRKGKRRKTSPPSPEQMRLKPTATKRRARERRSEVDAYIFVKDDLKNRGWICRNPTRTRDGQVWTQNECLDEPRIAEQLGLARPEYTIKISDTELYIIEAKPFRNQLEQAVQEAERDYAELVNQSPHVRCKIISGVAGNDIDGYLVRSKFFVNDRFEPVISNGKELTGLISPDIARYLIDNNTNIIEELPIDEKFFLETAEKINVILHNGAIPATDRGKVMSALLLSLVDETQPNVNASPRVLITEINARVNAVLQREGKPEFYDYIRIALPTTVTNHVKFKNALVKTIQELNNLNIRSAMNSGTDILGNFYEVFLKYGNWASEIGIVLTPRHITHFAAEILNVNSTDLIFDPTCGTAGFLVAAFDYVKRHTDASTLRQFKRDNIFGIEQEASVVALAIVNMIFRGDGKNNIKEANCLHEWLNLRRRNGHNTAEYLSEDRPDRHPPITKVLMNPPFALKANADKEYKFVEHAIKQMQHGGLLFSVLPTSEMLSRGQYKQWREALLKRDTLIAVITFPDELFYPIAINSCAIVVKVGEPHPADQKVLWLRAIHDGFVKRKGKRLKPKPPLIERDILTEYKAQIQQFIQDQTSDIPNEPEYCKLAPIDFADTALELVPEVYLDEVVPTTEEIKTGIEGLVRTTAGYLLTIRREDVEIKTHREDIPANDETAIFKLTDLCEVERKYAPYMNEILSDQKITPYVTTTEIDNGISIRCDSEPNFPKDTLSVSLDGVCGTTFYQFEPYIAGEKTAVLTIKPDADVTEDMKPHLLFYLGYIIRRKSWRYHYGRKLSEGRLKKFEVPLPVTADGKIDYAFIKALVESCYGWEVVAKALT